jgi:hypothetical protein
LISRKRSKRTSHRGYPFLDLVQDQSFWVARTQRNPFHATAFGRSRAANRLAGGRLFSLSGSSSSYSFFCSLQHILGFVGHSFPCGLYWWYRFRSTNIMEWRYDRFRLEAPIS